MLPPRLPRFPPLPPAPDWLTRAIHAARPPDWVQHELQSKLLLCVNHVLQQSETALPRTRQLAGRSVQFCWQGQNPVWVFTAVGLFEQQTQQTSHDKADLTLDFGTLTPIDMATHLWRGQRPALRIEGDAQMAAELNWLIDNLRWDPEEDLARLVGDARARALTQLAIQCLQALRSLRDRDRDRDRNRRPMGGDSAGFRP